MIFCFKQSRIIALVGGVALALAGFATGWFLGGAQRFLVALLVAFVGVSVALYAARLVAAQNYQGRLALLYTQLDPDAFLNALTPLLQTKMNHDTRAMLTVHLANGYLAAGQEEKAITLLLDLSVPVGALALRGLVFSNLAASYLQIGDANRAKLEMDHLHQLIADKKCKPEFAKKARYTLGYQQICLDALLGKKVDVKALESDFAASRSPYHKAQVQFQLAKLYRQYGDDEKVQAARAYITEHGGTLSIVKKVNML